MGEHAAIDSAIDELIPARYRGRVDVATNGPFWVGAAAGSLLTIPLLNPTVIDQGLGWRLAFGLGAVLAVGSFVGAALMILGGLTEACLGVNAEGSSSRPSRSR